MRDSRVILHPSDFSPASRPAFAQAVALAKERRAPLLVIHVLAPVILTSEGVAADIYDRAMRSARDEAQRRLNALVAGAKSIGTRVTGLLLEGVAEEQIVRVARGRRASPAATAPIARVSSPDRHQLRIDQRLLSAPMPKMAPGAEGQQSRGSSTVAFLR